MTQELTTHELQPLLDRVRAATGPDRSIDLDLAKHQTDWRVSRDPWWNWHPGPVFSPPGDELCIRRDGRRDMPCDEGLPLFTASTDAVLALTEWLFGTDSESMLFSYDLGWHASAHSEMAYTADLHIAVGAPPTMETFHGYGSKQPLAILAATLTALIARASA